MPTPIPQKRFTPERITIEGVEYVRHDCVNPDPLGIEMRMVVLLGQPCSFIPMIVHDLATLLSILYQWCANAGLTKAKMDAGGVPLPRDVAKSLLKVQLIAQGLLPGEKRGAKQAPSLFSIDVLNERTQAESILSLVEEVLVEETFRLRLLPPEPKSLLTVGDGNDD